MGKFSFSGRKLSHDISKVEHTVKCTLCGEILSCTSENTAPLVDHLRKKHPDIQVARFPELKSCIKDKGDENGTEHKAKSNNKDNLATDDNKKESVREKKIKKMYETTVEVWQSSQGPVLCETCGECQTPIVKVSKRSLSESSTAAMCLLGCWPLCFLPYMICGGNSENLTDSYCSKCGHKIKVKNSESKRE